jgi:hypothetical protein
MSNVKRDCKHLCYLEASKLEGPAGELAGLAVRTEGDEKLGTFDGVLIDPTQRRLRYFVVEDRGLLRRRRYLLSADVPIRVGSEGQSLRIDVHKTDVTLSGEFDLRTVRPYSSEDAVDAMFSRVA